MSFQENIVIQHITAEETLSLRSRILRPGQSLEKCRYPKDTLETTFHLGVLLDGKIICNGTFMRDVSSHFPRETSAYRLRGMATDPEFQGQHWGSRLLKQAEDILRHQNCKMLWFNAREKAFPFYEKNGFTAIGELFEIETLGPHQVMYKYL